MNADYRLIPKQFGVDIYIKSSHENIRQFYNTIVCDKIMFHASLNRESGSFWQYNGSRFYCQFKGRVNGEASPRNAFHLSKTKNQHY